MVSYDPVRGEMGSSQYRERREGHGDDVSICSRCSDILGVVDGLYDIRRSYRNRSPVPELCPVGKRFEISDNVQSVGFKAGDALPAGTFSPWAKSRIWQDNGSGGWIGGSGSTA
jgi:hypothetical protein